MSSLPAPSPMPIHRPQRAFIRGAAAVAIAVVPALAGAAGGATTPYWASAFAALAALVAGVVLLCLPRDPTRPVISRAEAWALGLVVLAALYAVSWPTGMVEAIAPETAAARRRATGDAAGAWSLDAGATASASLAFLGVWLLLVASRRVVDGGGALGLARALALVTLVHAGAAWLRGRYGEDDLLLLGLPVRGALNAWGTFPSRTQAAAFVLVGATGAIALAVRPASRFLDRTLGFLTLVVVAGSVAWSGSRAGVAGMASAVVFAAVFAARTRAMRASAMAVVGVVILLPVVAGLFAVGPWKGVMSFRAEEHLRLRIWAGTLELLGRQPAGIGLEAFPYAYPGQGRFPQDRWAGIAESDPLQGLCELGVGGLVLASVAAVYATRSFRRHARPGDSRAPMALAGLVATLPLAATGAPYHCPAVAGAAVVAWAVACGLVRGPARDGDVATPCGYALPTPEASWRAL